MINDVLNLMVSYNSPDIRRINHAIKVFSFALNIAENENCDKTIGLAPIAINLRPRIVLEGRV